MNLDQAQVEEAALRTVAQGRIVRRWVDGPAYMCWQVALVDGPWGQRIVLVDSNGTWSAYPVGERTLATVEGLAAVEGLFNLDAALWPPLPGPDLAPVVQPPGRPDP